jgi:MYXO-CTERM domain-containing protein
VSWIVRMGMAGGIALGLGAPVGARADFEANGVGYGTFAAAAAAAGAGGTVTVRGATRDDSVSVAVDGLTIVGDSGVLQSSATSVITVQSGLEVTIRNLRLERVGTATRGIELESGATLTVEDSSFNTGRLGSNGGGIYSLGGVSGITLERVTFEGVTGSDRGFDGGAVYVANAAGPVTLTDVAFSRVEASGNGGAIYSSNTDLTCTRCTFDYTNGVSGGAIYSAGSGSLTLTNSSVCGSSAGGGGAVYGSSTGTIRATRFSNSSATTAGGALFLNGGTWTVENNSFLAVAGGSVVDVSNSTQSLRNNLFYDNGAGLDLSVGNLVTVTAMAFNWFGDAARVFNYPTAGNDVSGDDPELAAWSDDGDCTNDLLFPAFGSPLIDAGAPALLDPDGSVSDVGAYGGPDADPALHGDDDGDGSPFLKDCDDGNAAMFPGNLEVCDTYDNDCNGLVDDDDPLVDDQDLWHPDCDNDGQGDLFTVVEACFAPAPICAGPWLSQDTYGEDAYSDCNDADPNTFLGADETCDDGDQNCDGDWDYGATDGVSYYEDADGDGYGDALAVLCDFSAPDGYVSVYGDCNDDPAADGASFYPGAYDSCGDGFDQDCNGGDGDDSSIVYWYPDFDHDGYGDQLVAPTIDCLDPSDGDLWYTTDSGDCDDTRDSVSPDGVEVCNLLDDDCDGAYDNLGSPVVWYPDTDEDGYGNTDGPVTADCPPDTLFPWTEVSGDCDDDDDLVSPDGVEVCNGIDDDCDDKLDAADDGLADGLPAYQDRDLDGHGACPNGEASCEPVLVCPDDLGDGNAESLGDCDDTNPAQNPGRIEVPGNSVDEDCDGYADPGRGPGETDDGRGCNCDAASSPSLAGALSALALLTLLRRRRQL